MRPLNNLTLRQQTLLECTLVGSLQNVCFLCHQLFKMATTTGHNVVVQGPIATFYKTCNCCAYLNNQEQIKHWAQLASMT
jgi:hypothetical protein